MNEECTSLPTSTRTWRLCVSYPESPKLAKSLNRYKNHRFPTEIISHGVWLYFRFCLSYRDVEELLFPRGVLVTYEAIRI
jgi:hypothetical protein